MNNNNLNNFQVKDGVREVAHYFEQQNNPNAVTYFNEPNVNNFFGLSLDNITFTFVISGIVFVLAIIIASMFIKKLVSIINKEFSTGHKQNEDELAMIMSAHKTAVDRQDHFREMIYKNEEIELQLQQEISSIDSRIEGLHQELFTLRTNNLEN